ncbi:MAG: hypothetical protein Q4G27_06290 [Flavobacteriaceae bacterium]|nr:hypothetical protein [Flavobacteriaceae bacterium]
MNDELFSKTVVWLRFPLMILVLFLHMNPQLREFYINPTSIDGNLLVGHKTFKIVTDSITYYAEIAVPSFFFFSGFYFFIKFFKWDKEFIHFFMAPILCSIICIFVYILLKRISPKLTGILTGNR